MEIVSHVLHHIFFGNAVIIAPGIKPWLDPPQNVGLPDCMSETGRLQR
jgi:hypothetical protein